MFEKLKDMFIDKDSGGIKITSVIAAAGGAVLGGMFLAPIMATLPVVGGMAGIIAPIIGGAGLLLGKEILMPMLGGSKAAPQQHPTTGFRSHDPHAGHGAPSQHHDTGLPTPNVPNHGAAPGMGEPKQR